MTQISTLKFIGKYRRKLKTPRIKDCRETKKKSQKYFNSNVHRIVKEAVTTYRTESNEQVDRYSYRSK